MLPCGRAEREASQLYLFLLAASRCRACCAAASVQPGYCAFILFLFFVFVFFFNLKNEKKVR